MIKNCTFNPSFKVQFQKQATILIPSFQTERAQIRLLLEEQYDKDLHYLSFNRHLLDALRMPYSMVKPHSGPDPGERQCGFSPTTFAPDINVSKCYFKLPAASVAKSPTVLRGSDPGLILLKVLLQHFFRYLDFYNHYGKLTRQ